MGSNVKSAHRTEISELENLLLKYHLGKGTNIFPSPFSMVYTLGSNVKMNPRIEFSFTSKTCKSNSILKRLIFQFHSLQWYPRGLNVKITPKIEFSDCETHKSSLISNFNFLSLIPLFSYHSPWVMNPHWGINMSYFWCTSNELSEFERINFSRDYELRNVRSVKTLAFLHEREEGFRNVFPLSDRSKNLVRIFILFY